LSKYAFKLDQKCFLFNAEHTTHKQGGFNMTAENVLCAIFIIGLIFLATIFFLAIAKRKNWKKTFRTKHLRLVDPKQPARN
jgi:hypothetical protein